MKPSAFMRLPAPAFGQHWPSLLVTLTGRAGGAGPPRPYRCGLRQPNQPTSPLGRRSVRRSLPAIFQPPRTGPHTIVAMPRGRRSAFRELERPFRTFRKGPLTRSSTWWRGRDLNPRPSGYELVGRGIGRYRSMSHTCADLRFLPRRHAAPYRLGTPHDGPSGRRSGRRSSGSWVLAHEARATKTTDATGCPPRGGTTPASNRR